MKTLDIKVKRNEIYCPKCKKMHSDTAHNAVLRLNIYDNNSYMFEHKFCQDPMPKESDKHNCESDTMRIYSDSMHDLVLIMLQAEFDIKDIKDGFKISMEGANKFEYCQPYMISFTVPDKYELKFEKMISRMNDNIPTMSKFYSNGVYAVRFTDSDTVDIFCKTIEELVSRYKDDVWKNKYLPKIISALVFKGYQVNGSESLIRYGRSEYKISLLDTSMIDTSRESSNSTAELEIRVRDDGIYFSNYGLYPDVYLEWVENLPDV